MKSPLLHLIIITPGFPSTNKSKPGIAVLRSVKELKADLDVIVPATTNKIYEPVLPKGRVHWVRYMPRALCLLQGSKGDGGIPVRLKRNPLYLILVPFAMLALFIKAIRLTRENSIIHAQWLPMAFIAAVIKVIKHNPILVTIRGADQVLWKKNILSPIIKWIFNSTDAVVTVSKTLADEIGESFNISDKIYFIPNGVTIPKKKIKNSDDKYMILYAGSLIPRKGVNILIEAFLRLKYELNIQLVIGGDGIERKKLESFVQTNNIKDNIVFIGEIPSNEVQDRMLESNFFVLPSYSEGTPNVVKEAMACGVPVIATNISGIPELIKHGETGLLFEPGDIDTLTKHMRFAIDNPEKMREMGIKGKKLIISKQLTWGNTAKMYEKVYEKIQNQNHGERL